MGVYIISIPETCNNDKYYHVVIIILFDSSFRLTIKLIESIY